MNIHTKMIVGLSMISVYIISLCCFLGTSPFESLKTLVGGSGIIAFIAVNVFVVFVFFITLFIGLKKSMLVTAVSAIFCFPAIAADSKYDWLDKFLHIKFESKAPAALNAFFILFVVIGLIVIHKLEEFEKEHSAWQERGASHQEIEEVKGGRNELFFWIILLITLPAVLVIVFSFMVLRLEKVRFEPIIFVLAGVIVASLCMGYFIFKSFDNKDNSH